MVKSKWGLVISGVLLAICIYLSFPFPDQQVTGIISAFMNFPLRNEQGYVLSGIIGSVLFIIALVLIAGSMIKYRIRAILLAILIIFFVPSILLGIYQMTFAKGIDAVSYDGKGFCTIETIKDGMMEGECNLTLKNRGGKPVQFELEFIDSDPNPNMRNESLMNEAGPYKIRLEPREEKTIELNEKIDVSKIPDHVDGGTSNMVHIKIKGDKKVREL